ncbi:phosphocarrier protein HPr [Neoasaia chiangmaiensis NBRC 101099]|uniref:Serine kinase n=1 Tax=Neoasaia chiangmaiensis TaxID=320497 RepID=A0A1U9KPQ1_9PROT|nr:HPr family phosphocarrier protein [Neoasaia chiangmaiensis]AQS87777.1 serine kinase [Neoasaia chiangmaiensis]GBR41585.1 phosphocarrier protein HPr [Neoasaia chiangmaiensis NBRC 101099]GEN14380.1 HPr kinase [Neoasaia chiangmaiensis]
MDGTDAITKDVVIVNRLGLHARAAAKLVSLAERYQADIEVSRGGQSVSALSIMGLMMLGAGRGEQVRLAATGPQGDAALVAVAALIADGFGERD